MASTESVRTLTEPAGAAQLPAPRPAPSRPAPAQSPAPARGGTAGALLRLTRPEQWLKNLAVVPLALLDTRSWSAGALRDTAEAVLAFTLMSAFIYVVNDLKDKDRDRRHPVKRHRPIASGQVGTALAGTLAGLLLAAVALLVAATGGIATGWPVLAYLVVNIAYTAGLKHVPLVDVFCVATGFVLRLVQGYLALGKEPSQWLELCVFAFCLLLIIGKRRREMTVGGTGHRPALAGYSVPLLDNLIGLAGVLAVISYALYLYAMAHTGAVAQATAFISAPCAIFGVARHIQIMLVQEGGGNPVHSLFRDRISVVNSLVWAALFATTVLLPHA